MTLTALITFVALYCWLGCSWRKDKQLLRDLDEFRDHLAACVMPTIKASNALLAFSAAMAKIELKYRYKGWELLRDRPQACIDKYGPREKI